MTYTRNLKRFVVLVVAVSANVSCGDVVRQGKSPVYLVVDSLLASRGGVGAG